MSKIIKNYRDNEALRHSFNRLATATFGLDFEDWYQNGFWGENYIPYSIVQEGEVIANVSVNIMDMNWNGTIKHFIQLGTVMTAENYRNRGCIREIMQEIDKDYREKAEGFYLFANDSVLDFYPKFGYRKAKEYQYSKQVSYNNQPTMKPAPMKEKSDWTKLEHAIRNSAFHGQFDMADNSALFMFYVTKFMQENVCHDEVTDTFAIAEIEDGTLFLHAVFSQSKIALEDIIKAFGREVNKVILGFTPSDSTGYDCTELKEEDTTLFVKGEDFADFEQQHLMFPTLSHA